MTVEVQTFGCRLNSFESEVMRAHARDAGLRDVAIVNTCAVTEEAVRQARQAIRKLRRERPDRKIVVTGCAAQTDPGLFAGMAEVDRVMGNADKVSSAAWVDAREALTRARDGVRDVDKCAVADIAIVRETALHLVDGLEGRARAFVQIQNGCDHRCTFCIIPYGRGPSRSVPMGAVVEQVRLFVERGVQEVVLTGVDITSYGADLPGYSRLGTLTRQILKHVPELPRLRISSIDSVEADPELMRLFAEQPRLMPHLHLSLQAGDDLVLKRMKRRHSRADAIAFCATMRRLRPDIVFGADLIAGFPTETDEMFARSLALVEDCGLTFLHVFPFSPRPGTPAARMPQVPRAIGKERAAQLRAAGELALRTRLAAEIGSERHVLAETEHSGRTEHFLPVHLAQSVQPGAIVRSRIDYCDDRQLYA